MIKCSMLFLFVTLLITICSGLYLPKKQFIKQSSQEWTETAKNIGWSEKQIENVISLMKFIQENDITSAEMDSNEEWKKIMMDKCKKVANFDEINELNEFLGDKKWSDVEDADFATKWEFWNDKYTKWDSEERKMIALKNMCIVVTEDAEKKDYMNNAKLAGYNEAKWVQIADMVWQIVIAKSTGLQKSILANHCELLNDDGKMFKIDDEDMPKGMKWSDMTNKNISMKMDFWWNVTQQTESNVAKMKAGKNFCVEFMCPDERKIVKEWAKEAGILEDELNDAVDMEMKMLMANSPNEQRDIIMNNFEHLGKNKYMMEPKMTEEEKNEAVKLENADWVKRVHFWGKKYQQTIGADHMKCLKNMCVVIAQEKMMKEEEQKNVSKKDK